ncbi:MAG: PAS domain S-box protein [Gemmataceae bacterium]|nr:PAS domain S-box protein [Gemmataceae bacterium]
MSESADAFRWQSFFQHAAQPMFLVNRRRRVLFVNRAWEACTGLTLADVRGRVCRRRSASAEKDEATLSVCAPPLEAIEGRTCQVRRRAPGGAGWWEIHFLPLAGAKDLLGILGTVRVIAPSPHAPFTLPDKLMALRDRSAARYRLDDLELTSPALQRVHEQAKLAAQTRVPMTLLGEAGAGKEWLARAIHAHGDQRQRYFACLDAERLPAPLLGELLFGTRSLQLAFGTVYLREPAFLPREWQGRLADTLHLRENPEFPRLIIGMRHDPRLEIQSGRLLEELYCAVSPLTIALPPLRDRSAELPRFIDVFLARLRELEPHAVHGVGPEALTVLRAHSWPGNLRELQAVVHGAYRRAKLERIELADLPFYVKQGPLPAERRLPLDTLLEQVERRLIGLALKLTQNNHTRAAELLEIWRPRLLRRVEKLGFKSDDHQTPG